MEGTPVVGLRARQRIQTTSWIHRAALDLFEAQGVRATTVQQIAERAGVSSRTFFRYFTSKEQAAIPGPQRLLDAMDDLAAPPGGDVGAVLDSIAEMMIEVLRDESPELGNHQRIMALLAAEPDLSAEAVTQQRMLGARLRERLLELHPETDPLVLHMMAELSILWWHSVWTVWGEAARRGEDLVPAAVFEDCRRALATVAGAFGERHVHGHTSGVGAD